MGLITENKIGIFAIVATLLVPPAIALSKWLHKKLRRSPIEVGTGETTGQPSLAQNTAVTEPPPAFLRPENAREHSAEQQHWTRMPVPLGHCSPTAHQPALAAEAPSTVQA